MRTFTGTYSQLFEAVWDAIKKWDIERIPGAGRAGANGSDVKIILDAVEKIPIDMILHCPKCHMQHIDKPGMCYCGGMGLAEVNPGVFDTVCPACGGTGQWTNPPHKTHYCHNCKTLWRPANTPTNGVERL